MISVRNGVFETNSSSVHALSFNYEEVEKYDKNINKNETLNLVYEREGVLHETLKDKLILLINIVYQSLNVSYKGNKIYTNAKINDDILHDRCTFDVKSNLEDVKALKQVIKKLGIDTFNVCEDGDHDFKFDWTDDFYYCSGIEDFLCTFVDYTSPEQYTYDTDYSISKNDAYFLANDNAPLVDKILLFLNLPCSVEVCYGE